jgi:NAD(P)-dependent dehydrogenase (short-subunit alcohol dehydrogenase family)
MNKTIFITGGAIRIGKEICKKFHQEGFNIICHYNSSVTSQNSSQRS